MMNNFSFDLQRFDGFWKIDNETYSTLTEALAAITGNVTITLTADISEVITSTIPSNITIDLNDHAYTITDGTLTIKDGVMLKGGTLNINDSASINADDITLTLNGAKINIDTTGVIAGNINFVKNAADDDKINSVAIKNGTFTGNLIIDKEIISEITGGTFANDVSDYLAENFSIYQNGDTYSVVMVTSSFQIANPITTIISAGNVTFPVTLGGESVTITSGFENDVTVNYNNNFAAIDLSVNEQFYVNNVIYDLESAGPDGKISVTLGSQSAATVGSLDAGDNFVIGTQKFLMTKLGLLGGGSTSTENFTKMVIGTNLSSVAFNGENPSAWYKILEVDDKKLNISSLDYFDSAGYEGVIAVDTDVTPPTTYAQLAKTNSGVYNISSVDGGTVPDELILADVKNNTFQITQQFTATKNSPTITAGSTKC